MESQWSWTTLSQSSKVWSYQEALAHSSSSKGGNRSRPCQCQLFHPMCRSAAAPAPAVAPEKLDLEAWHFATQCFILSVGLWRQWRCRSWTWWRGILPLLFKSFSVFYRQWRWRSWTWWRQWQ